PPRRWRPDGPPCGRWRDTRHTGALPRATGTEAGATLFAEHLVEQLAEALADHFGAALLEGLAERTAELLAEIALHLRRRDGDGDVARHRRHDDAARFRRGGAALPCADAGEIET